MLKLRKANESDLDTAYEIFKLAIEEMDKNNIHQWDNLYPTKDILKDDILKNQLFLGEINREIASVFVLNKEYDEEYSNMNWKYKDASFFILHRLCVNPKFQNQGIGTNTMRLIEEFSKGEGIETIRLDAFSLNPFALKMYEKAGYSKVGGANWWKRLFYLYEKLI